MAKQEGVLNFIYRVHPYNTKIVVVQEYITIVGIL